MDTTGTVDDEEFAAAVMAAGLDRLRFDNLFVDRLAVDESTVNRPRQVHRAMSSRVVPAQVSAPTVLAWSVEVSDQVGIDRRAWTSHPELMAELLSGNRLLPGMDPHAACYGGHQFGHWAGQLGDGRAISLGEVVGADGGRHTLQLKGAGLTPYSRGADGLAVLRSSIREFLCSEAMHHLGVTTTRALSLVATGDKVVRDMFYDGNPRPEPGAIVCRVAPSFIRFGNFQIFAARQELDELRWLTDFTIEHYFAPLLDDHEPGADGTYLALFDEVCRTTRAMVIDWMRVGFVHGVMNTDNMSIHGATIDYGPYGWLDGFDPNWTPNTTDATHRRYRYGHQPRVAHWNLLQLANTLVQLTGEPEPFQQVLNDFGTAFGVEFRAMWRAKLGLDTIDDVERADELVNELFGLLTRVETDMTIFFRRLATVAARAEDGETDETLVAPLSDAYYDPVAAAAIRAETADFLRRYRRLLFDHSVADEVRRRSMNARNPTYVLRNYQAQLAIDATEQDDPSRIGDLLDVLRHPYEERPGLDEFAAKRPEWARERPGCSMLSCSS